MARKTPQARRQQTASRAAQGNQVLLSTPIDGAYLAAVAAVHVTTAAGSGAVSCWGDGVRQDATGAATDGKHEDSLRTGTV